MNVKSRAIRILRPLTRYRNLSTISPAPGYTTQGVKFQEGESCLGVYENVDGSLQESVLVTNVGLHVHRRREWGFVDYADIESIRIPSRKEEADTLEIHRYSGHMDEIPVRGARGKSRDAFEFLLFLNRVTADIQVKNRQRI